jgi:uncharacterized protein (TIGR03000 family)
MKRLAILGVALVLATPAVSSAQFRTIAPVGSFGIGWPSYFGWPGYGYGGYGYGGYGFGGYPYTFGGMGYGWPGSFGYSYGYGGNNYSRGSVGLTNYTIPNVGMPQTSQGGLPTRWNGVDLTGTGNLAMYQQPSHYLPSGVTTSGDGTLPAANLPARDRTDFVPSDFHAHIRVRLPAGGQVTFDGVQVRLTNGTGRFISPELAPGSRYVYDVRARWTDATGRRHNEGRSVVVRAGQHVDVSFGSPRR